MLYQQILLGILLLITLALALRGMSAINFGLVAKGYGDSLNWCTLLALAPIVGIFLPGFVTTFWHDRTPKAMLSIVALCPIGVLAMAESAKFILKHLPEAPRKPLTRSRFPFALCGIVSAAFIIIRPVMALISGTGWLGAIASGYVPMGVTLVFFGLSLRASSKSLTEETNADPRPQVLYIRPFATEGHVFAHDPWKGLWFLSIFEESSFDSPDGKSSNKTFGAFFQEAVREKIGPFITLGSPWNRFPRIDGPSQEYCTDDAWKEIFAQRAAEAAIIMASADTSDNLSWELRYLRNKGLASKLFLCTPPKSDPRLASVLKVLAYISGGDSLKYCGLRSTPWTESRIQLKNAAFDPPEEDPGPGAVLASTSDGKIDLIKTGAKTPDEFITAIQRHRRKS